MKGCMNSSSVRLGEKVTLSRVFIDTEVCTTSAKTARRPVVEHVGPMDPERTHEPVVQRLDLAEQLDLPVDQVAVEVVLLLPAREEGQLAIPPGRLGPDRYDVAAHVPVVGPG